VSTPRKHHFVPQFLLRGFADEKESLVVNRLDPPGWYVSKVRDIGHENDAHTRVRGDGSIDRSSLEAAMSDVEGDAATAVRDLANGGELTEEHKSALAWFIAMQWHRSRYLLNAVANQLPESDLTRDEIQTGLLDVVFVPFFSAWRLRDDTSVRPKDRWDSIVSAVWSMEWSVCRFRTNALVLGDQTVCMYGVRPGGRASVNEAWARHGIGIGWGDVGRVTVALTPRLGLNIHPPEVPARLRAPAFNRITIYNARRFVLHGPEWPQGHVGLQTAFDEAMSTQRWLAPVFYKNVL
jgi:hypothetical protein